MTDCIFCNIKEERIINENEYFLVIRDAFPVSLLHTLFIPKRHCKDYFELTQAEINAANQLIHTERERLLKLDKTITGFNIGINCGEDAGQTVFHCHVHLIPRRRGDVKNAKGGVRGVISSKQSY